MKKLLVLAIFILASALFPIQSEAYTTASYTSAKLTNVTEESSAVDLRVQALKNVFAKYNSPLVESAEFYVKRADEHGIDWKLLPAIAGLESTFGNRMIDATHNAYGWGSGKIYFESWDDGINTILGSLRTRYIDRGATTVYEIGSIYAESPTWAVRVEYFMNEIAEEYQKLSLQRPLALAI